jgi:hypothetical protein
VKAVGLTSGGLRCVPDSGLRSPQGGLTAAQKSAEGIVGGTSFAEGLNNGRTLGRGDLEPAMRPNIQITGFRSDGKGEALDAPLERTEAAATGLTV